MNPLVSIVIPVFNAERYLDECLSSILQQYYQDWECIMVDDGSVDSSRDICEYYSGIDTRFRLIIQSNTGVSSARNRALDEVKGDWVCFVDSDDWVDPDYLDMMISLSQNADLVVSGQIREYTDNRVSYLIPNCTGLFTISPENAEEFVRLERLLLLYAPHEKLFRSAIIKKWCIRFPLEYSYGEDLVFNYSYLDKINSIRYLSEAKYHYRINPDSLSNSFRPNQFEVDYSQWKILKSYYDRHQLLCKLAEEYLYRRLWGIVYDGLFIYPFLVERSSNYLRGVLVIPEIDELKQYRSVFPCSSWIKWAILERCSSVFILYFKFHECIGHRSRS